MTDTLGRAPASRLQTRLWLFSRLYPELPFFMIPVVLRLHGEVCAAGVRAALDAVVERHDALYTRLVAGDDGPEQEPGDRAVPLEVSDLSGQADPEAAWAAVVRDEFARPLDMERGPLLRARLARLGDGDHMLALFVHHVCVDGQSLNVILRELATGYAAWETGQDPAVALGPVPPGYREHAAWLERTAAGAPYARSRKYWADELGGQPDFDPAADRPRPERRTFEVDREETALPDALVTAVTGFARQQRVTPFVVFGAALAALLGRRAGVLDDVVLATPWSLRQGRWLDSSVGFFANTVPLRIRMAPESTFRDVVSAARGTVFDAMDHCAVPFDEIVALANPVRRANRMPLTSVCFQVLDSPVLEFELGSARARIQSGVDDGASEFDLIWEIRTSADGAMTLCAKYTPDIFDRRTVRRMSRQFLTLLDAVLAEPERPVREAAMHDPAERSRLLALATAADGPQLTVLDDLGEPAAVGVLGEVCTVRDAVLSRTGRRARRREDDSLEFEPEPDPRHTPADVATILAQHPAVRSAAVVPSADGTGTTGLVATDDPTLSAEALRAFLLGRLPAEAVPSWFVVLDDLPLTDDGEVHPELLDALGDLDAGGAGGDAWAGATEFERTVREVWEQCLGAPVPRPDTAFFDLGHSLIAVRIAARLQKMLGRRIPVGTVLEQPTVRSLAAHLAAGQAAPPTEPARTAAATEPATPRGGGLTRNLAGASAAELALLAQLTGGPTAAVTGIEQPGEHHDSAD